MYTWMGGMDKEYPQATPTLTQYYMLNASVEFLPSFLVLLSEWFLKNVKR